MVALIRTFTIMSFNQAAALKKNSPQNDFCLQGLLATVSEMVPECIWTQTRFPGLFLIAIESKHTVSEITVGVGSMIRRWLSIAYTFAVRT